MSDFELENAAMGPRRWIELCGAFEKQHLYDGEPDPILYPQTTRLINDSDPIATEVNYFNTVFFIVPGGRYLVRFMPFSISVLDMCCTSSADCKLIASIEPSEGWMGSTWEVQATPDGMGLVIFASNE